MGRPAHLEEGQHRLRPARPLRRLGRHAWHHHRGGAEIVSATGRDGRRAGGAPRYCERCGAVQLGGGARTRGSHGVRVHEPLHARSRFEAHSQHAAAAARTGAVVRPRRIVERRAGRSSRGDDAAAAYRGGRQWRRIRRRHRRIAGPVAGAVAVARNRIRSAAARRRQHQARCLGAGRSHPRSSHCGGHGSRASVPRRAARGVRPLRRRQRALQRHAAGRRWTGPHTLRCGGRCRKRCTT